MTDKEINDAAELSVRRYFDHYLEDIHPKLMLEHGHSCTHGKFLNKFKWIMVGMLIMMPATAPTLVKQIISMLK